MTAKSVCAECGAPIEYDGVKWKAKEAGLNIEGLKKDDTIMINGNKATILEIQITEERMVEDEEHNHLITGRITLRYSRKIKD